MSDSWATSSLDLHLERPGIRVRAGLEEALRDAVRSGRLGPGARLPSSRALAGDLGIARNTVAEVYAQLVAEGWLVARQGSGTTVAARVPTAERLPAVPARRAAFRHDLRAGSPDVSLFPGAAWLAAARRALNAVPAGAFGYTDPRGHAHLREVLAAYLGRTRGVRAGPEQIVVCAGFTQGLGLLCQVLRARGGATLAMEAYGVRDHRRIPERDGLGLRWLGVDGEGAQVEAAGDADAIVVTPAHQFPLGVPLAPHRRAWAVEWAHRTGGLVIEDDYDGEFRYDRQPVGAMQALAPDHVVYAGTASKSLAPGIRLGWLVLPPPLVDEVVQAQALAVRNLSVVDQLTLAEVMRCGAYDRHIRRCRLAYRRRRDRLVAAVAAHAPSVRVRGIAAGLHAMLELPEGAGELELVARAAQRGLAIEGLSEYGPAGGPHHPALVVGYATPPEHGYSAALAQLVAVLAEL